jgi:hypothetical protein
MYLPSQPDHDLTDPPLTPSFIFGFTFLFFLSSLCPFVSLVSVRLLSLSSLLSHLCVSNHIAIFFSALTVTSLHGIVGHEIFFFFHSLPPLSWRIDYIKVNFADSEDD